MLASPAASAAPAAAREDVLPILEQIASGPQDALEVWVNDAGEHRIEEGTPISLHFRPRTDTYLTALYVDAEGRTILLLPAGGTPGEPQRGEQELRLDGGTAVAPYGLETLFVVASSTPISREALGIETSDRYPVLTGEEAVAVAGRLRQIVAAMPASSVATRRVDHEIVPERVIGRGYTKSGIIRYFTEALRSVRRPRLALDIKFDFDSEALLESARSELDVVGAALADPRLQEKRFILAGHTDHQGSEEYNRALSLRRARAARRYLIENFGIDPGRLEAVGYGESRPTDPGASAEEMAARNRRVELELIR
jgi:outer membrane protein OmpA-like peptidoglycan-associated protein